MNCRVGCLSVFKKCDAYPSHQHCSSCCCVALPVQCSPDMGALWLGQATTCLAQQGTAWLQGPAPAQQVACSLLQRLATRGVPVAAAEATG